MPRVRTPALARLALELGRTPRARLLEQIERAEAVAADLDPAASYPIDWLVFRLTGYRRDGVADELVTGEALLGDLSALVERLCSAAGLTERDLPPGSVGADELAERWGVSRKTVDRLRRRGLIARRVDREGRTRLVFSPVAVAGAEARAGDRLARARAFTRTGRSDAERIVRRAARYRARLRCSLSAAAQRLAARFGMSHEGVRQLLLRHDERERAAGRAGIFPAPRSRDRATRFALLRAARDGAEPADLAERAGASGSDPRSAQRLVAGLRLALLRRLDLEGAVSPVFERADAEAVLLGPASVRDAGGAGGGAPELGEQIARARAHRPGGPEVEAARATALAYLRWRARAALGGISGRSVSLTTLDEILSDLRTAGLLRGALVADQVGSIVRTIEGVAGPLDGLSAGVARALVETGCAGAGRVAERFAPWRGGRLAAAVTLAVSRQIAGRPTAGVASEGRAKRRIASGEAGVDPCWASMGVTERCVLWPRYAVRVAWLRGGLDPLEAEVLGRRLGWDGRGPAETLEGLAESLGTTRMRVAQRERGAVRGALAGERAMVDG